MGSEVLALWLVMGCKEKYKPPEAETASPTASLLAAPPTAHIRFESSRVSVAIRVRSGRVDDVKVSFKP